MEEDISEYFPLFPVIVRGGAGDDDTLRIDHFSHHAAGTVRGAHENGIDASLLGGDFLEATDGMQIPLRRDGGGQQNLRRQSGSKTADFPEYYLKEVKEDTK